MSKIRVYQVAKDLNVSSKDIISKLEELKIEVNNHMSTLEDNEVVIINKVFSKGSEQKPEPKKTEAAPVKKAETVTEAPVKKAETATEAPEAKKAESKQEEPKKKSWTVGTPKVNRPKRKSDFQNRNNSQNRTPQNSSTQAKPVQTTQSTEAATTAPVQNEPVEKKDYRVATANAKRAAEKKDYRTATNKPASTTKPGEKKDYRTATNRPASTTKPGEKIDYRTATNRPAGTTKPGEKKDYRTATNRPASTTKPGEKVDYRTATNRPASTTKPGEKKDYRTATNRPASTTSKPTTDTTPIGAKTNTKKKKKKDHRTEYTKNASLETKFSKKTRGKKKRKVEKAADNAKYFEDGFLMIPELVRVSTFAEMLDQTPSEVIMKLMSLGIMANLNEEIKYETAELVAMEFEIETKMIIPVDETEVLIDTFFEETEDPDAVSRPPVVTVMGHVDHGKTSLLDAIRETAVTDKEAGGITQHIGASEAMINGQKIVFLDTPGHEAFTTLRARGAQVTDIAVLVVAADDGVMPQTIEAIDHAKAAGVPIIVAINKIDKVGNNPDQVKKELSEHGILVEEWGGDVISVEVSALKKINIQGLLEMILLQSEVLELKANPAKHAIGTIIDAKVEKGRGIVTTLLIQNGTLAIGNSIVCGSSYGRVRAVFNHLGKRVKKAGPSSGVEITGLTEVPIAGDRFFVVDNDKIARSIAEKKSINERNEALKGTPQHVTLEDIFDRIQAGKTKEIKIVLKGDVQGSLEALKTSLEKISNEEVTVNIIHTAVGTVTESDVLLASASDAIIIGFNVRPIQNVETLAMREGVELKTYRIIYEAIADVSDALIGMLDPEFKEEVLGKVEVRQLIKVPNFGVIAGGYVLTGKVTRAAEFRLIREGIIVHEGKINSLRRFKDDVKEVAKGYECGIGFEGFNDMKENDIIEAFHMVEIKRKK